jgi:hypothetical protein
MRWSQAAPRSIRSRVERKSVQSRWPGIWIPANLVRMLSGETLNDAALGRRMVQSTDRLITETILRDIYQIATV